MRCASRRVHAPAWAARWSAPEPYATGLVKPAFGSTLVTPNPWRHETGLLVVLEVEPQD